MDKFDGIISFRAFRHIRNTKMEGLNNKIRWLIKHAYEGATVNTSN